MKTHKAVSQCGQKQPRDSSHNWKEKKRSWLCHFLQNTAKRRRIKK